jgi:hypothetical protein
MLAGQILDDLSASLYLHVLCADLNRSWLEQLAANLQEQQRCRKDEHEVVAALYAYVFEKNPPKKTRIIIARRS